jgi:hypothetical protein
MVTAEFKEYLVREEGQDTFTVSKWEGGKEPSAVYTCKLRRGKWECNCPSGHSRGQCPHPEIIKKWIKSGKKPVPIEGQFSMKDLLMVLAELKIPVKSGKVRIRGR